MEDIIILKIHSNKYPNQKVLIDKEDEEKVSKYNWHIHKDKNTFYAISHIRNAKGIRTTISLHRYLMDFPYNKFVDHKNGNGLDCRRGNMRICTLGQNHCNIKKQKNNTSGFKGVHPRTCKSRNKVYFYYVAQIGINNKQITLGYFKTKEEAHRAYCEAAKKHHKEFARTA